MPAIYLCDVIGTGAPRDSYRSSIATLTNDYVALMIDDNPARPRNQWRSVAWCTATNLSGAGVTLVQQAATKDALIALLQGTALTNQVRNVINNWATGGGYSTLPVGAQSQYDAILFICRQVNPAVDLSVLQP